MKPVILVIDDEKSVVVLASTFLTRAGYQVLTAESGEAGYRVLEKRVEAKEPTSLVVTDWKMPGWDGIRVMAEIRNGPAKDVPILLMSAALTREELLKAAAAHPRISILLKPLVRDIFLKKVEEILGKSAAAGG